MPCKRCRELDRRCAFQSGDTDNWCCGTLSELRRIANHRDIGLGVVGFPEDTPHWIVLSWDRGRVGQAYVFCDDDFPRPLKEAELAISQR